METITVHNYRAKVLVTVRVMVEDGGERSDERWQAFEAIVSNLVDENIREDIKALRTLIKESGVPVRFGAVSTTEKDLQLNDTKGLHRLARDVAEYLQDLRENKLIPGKGEPGPLPGIDSTCVTAVQAKAHPVPESHVGSVDVEVAL